MTHTPQWQPGVSLPDPDVPRGGEESPLIALDGQRHGGIVPSLFLAGAFVIGAAAVVGYLTGDAAVGGFWTGRGATAGLTGVFLMALAGSVALRRSRGTSARTAALILAVLAAIGSLLEVVAVFSGQHGSQSGDLPPLHPYPVTSGMIFILALMALTSGRPRTRILSHVLGSVIFVSCLVILFGMVYSVPWFVDADTRVFPVLSTTAALLMLSWASLLIEPAGWMRVLLSPTGTGKLSRLLLPAAIAIPMLTALAVYGRHEAGALSRGDLTIVVAVNMLVATALIVGAGALIERREAESRRLASLAEQELHRREQEFKALVENTPDIISRFDRDLIRRYINPAVERLTGIPPSELIGKHYGAYGPFHGGEKALREVFATGQEVVFEQQIHSPDGTRFLQSRIAPELDRSHEVEFALSITRDVTEIRRNEERLRESEAQFANAQRIAKIGSFELVLETGRMRWSEELFRVVGLPPGDPPTTRFLMSRVAREDSGAVLRAYQAALDGGALQHVEYGFTRPDGAARIFAISMEPARDAAGVVTKVTGTVQDVTDLREAEQSVRISEQRLRDLIDSANDAILTLDLTGRVLEVNPAVVQMFGEPVEVLVGRHITHSIHPDHVETIGRALREVVETGSVARIAAPVRTARGDYIEIEASASRQARKGADAIFIIGRDVTAQRQAESERLALTRSIELLLASTYEGICVTDLAGNCTLVNSSAAHQLGYTQSEMIGRNIHELIHHSRADGSPYPEADCPNFAAAREKQRVHAVDEVYWRRDGTSFPVEVFVSPIVVHDGAEDDNGTVQGIVMSFIDVTERQFLQTELERANRLAGLGRVAATMSHEFNNVLMGIQPFADALLRSSDPKVLAIAARITQSVKRGRRVTDELRGFTRPVPPVRNVFDVGTWLEDCAIEISRLLPANVELTRDVTESLPIEADREQVTQVISNLVLNARDAIGSAKGTVRISARPVKPGEKFSRGEMPSGRPFICVSVADDGPGILPEHLPRLFEPFFSTKTTGTGLGLPIAQQIVTLHGGLLFVESEEGRGATAHFLLPAARMAPSAIESDAPIVARAGIPMNIVLVEDDEAVAAGLSALLEHEGFDLRVAGDGAAALRLLDDQLPDVLIIDVGLPDCNGFDLYDDIASRHGAVPVVFSSGHADAARLATLQPGTAARLLTKPYDVGTLLRTLQQVCEPRPS